MYSRDCTVERAVRRIRVALREDVASLDQDGLQRHWLTVVSFINLHSQSRIHTYGEIL